MLALRFGLRSTVAFLSEGRTSEYTFIIFLTELFIWSSVLALFTSNDRLIPDLSCELVDLLLPEQKVTGHLKNSLARRQDFLHSYNIT
jgi:hypothetical protein